MTEKTTSISQPIVTCCGDCPRWFDWTPKVAWDNGSGFCELLCEWTYADDCCGMVKMKPVASRAELDELVERLRPEFPKAKVIWMVSDFGTAYGVGLSYADHRHAWSVGGSFNDKMEEAPNCTYQELLDKMHGFIDQVNRTLAAQKQLADTMAERMDALVFAELTKQEGESVPDAVRRQFKRLNKKVII